MTKQRVSITWICLILPVLAVTAGCGSSSDTGADTREEKADKVEERGIRHPFPPHVQDEIGSGNTVNDPSSTFDDRRDVWEDEFRTIGEVPSRWNQANPEHIAVHGPRPVRKYGFQWMRSYARNASVALFDRKALVELTDGTVQLKKIRELSEDRHLNHMELVAQGWDLCPEKRFADQVRGGEVADALCSGTLIDRNLVLTANHCLRDQFENTLERPLEDVRLVFNYVVPSRGEPPQVLSGRDVYRVREVLSVHVNFADFAILQLLDLNGNPVDADPSYQPVPIWESEIPPTPGLYRSGAIIGVGAQLPQKISLSRSWGWQPDAAFLGVHFRVDTFKGNSGGGVFDVETGTLVGVVHAQGEPTLRVTCPGNPATTTWPACRRLKPDPTPSALPGESLVWVPEFDNLSGPEPKWRGCNEWVSHEFGGEKALATERLIEQRFNVVDAKIDPAPFQEGLGLSIHTVRRLACQPAVPGQTFATTITQEANEIIAERNAFATTPACANASRCPTARVIDDTLPAQVIHQSELADPGPLLRSSRLCTGTVPPPRASEWLDVQPISLEDGREVTVHGTIADAPDYFSSAADGSVPAPDALYRLEVGQWTILYADTFSGGHDVGPLNKGTNFDTTLTLLESQPIGDNVTLDPSNWTVFDSQDDSHCQNGAIDVNFRRQTQIIGELQPGKKYLLMVSGFNGATGDFNLHIQSIPNPRQGSLLFHDDAPVEVVENGITYKVFAQNPMVPPGASEQNCMDQNGPLEPLCIYNTINPKILCQGRDSGEVALVAISCPEFASEQFTFRVRGESSPNSEYLDDPVASYWEGHARHSRDAYVCSDDTTDIIEIFPGFSVPINLFNAEVGHPQQVGPTSAETYLSSGAAVRGFYAHQFVEHLNWERLDYVLKLPADAAHRP